MNKKTRDTVLTCFYWILNLVILAQIAVLGLMLWSVIADSNIAGMSGNNLSTPFMIILYVMNIVFGFAIMIPILLIVRKLFLNCRKEGVFIDKNRKLIWRCGVLLLIKVIASLVIRFLYIVDGKYPYNGRMVLTLILTELPSLILPAFIIFFSYLIRRGIHLKNENDLTI